MNAKMIKTARKMSRQAELEHRAQHGKPRATSWGGKPKPRDDRRQAKKNLHNMK